MTSDGVTSLRRARADPAAFGEFYREHARPLLVFFVRRTFDVEAARDLTAETFAEALQHLDRFSGSSDREAGAWLYGIARHQLSHYHRRGVVERKAAERCGMQMPRIAPDDYARIVEAAGLADLRARVATAFATLTPPQRDALRLRVIDERPYEDVADALGVSQQTARARVSRALHRLIDAIDMPDTTEVVP